MSHPSDCSCSRSSFRWPRGVSRRDVLKVALSGAGIMALGPLARRIPAAHGAPVPGQKTLVVIDLDGGCDTLNAVIPLAVPEYATRRPTLAVPPASALSLASGPGGPTAYGLHPQFDRLQTLWNDGDVGFVHKVGYPIENLSHFESQDVFSRAVRGDFGVLGLTPSGWIARYAEVEAPTPTGAVSIGMGRPTSFVGGASNPLQVSSLQAFRFNSDPGASNNHLYRVQLIQQMLAASTATGTPAEVRTAVEQAYDLSAQVQAALSAYNTYAATSGVVWPSPSTSISRNLKDVAALVYAGFDTRVFFTGIGGFDTHGGQGTTTGTLPTLFQRVDDAIGAFVADMKNMGTWDDTAIVLYTEFGRRNYENGSQGTDHGAGFEMIVLGGAVNGGLYGQDITSQDLQGEYLEYSVDFRDVYREVLKDHLGVGAANLATVFPEPQPPGTVTVPGIV